MAITGHWQQVQQEGYCKPPAAAANSHPPCTTTTGFNRQVLRDAAQPRCSYGWRQTGRTLPCCCITLFFSFVVCLVLTTGQRDDNTSLPFQIQCHSAKQKLHVPGVAKAEPFLRGELTRRKELFQVAKLLSWNEKTPHAQRRHIGLCLQMFPQPSCDTWTRTCCNSDKRWKD